MATVKFSPRQALPKATPVDGTKFAEFGVISSYMFGNGRLGLVISGMLGSFTLKGDDKGTMLEITDAQKSLLGTWRLLPGRAVKATQRTAPRAQRHHATATKKGA